jgi:hypothetical protein
MYRLVADLGNHQHLVVVVVVVKVDSANRLNLRLHRLVNLSSRLRRLHRLDKRPVQQRQVDLASQRLQPSQRNLGPPERRLAQNQLSELSKASSTQSPISQARPFETR